MYRRNQKDEQKLSECLLCFKDIQTSITIFNYFKRSDVICGICRSKFELCEQTIEVQGMQVYALYYYNEWFENVMFLYKESKDVALYSLFLLPFVQKLRKRYSGFTIVYAPTSKRKEQERGFQTLPLLFSLLNFASVEAFYKDSEYKQSSQQYKDRVNVVDVIKRKQHLNCKKVLLVDDMCTSGHTLQAMYNMLKDECEIKILTIGINKKLLK